MDQPVSLRLAWIDDRVGAYCRVDDEQWYGVGSVTFPRDASVPVGVYAIGMVDRSVYHGAYPEGTAIRFTSFRLGRQ
jgi:hypothetical protein